MSRAVAEHPSALVRLHRELKEWVVIPYLLEGQIYFWSGYLVFVLCYHFLGFRLFPSTAIQYVFGLIINFILVRYWVFAKQARRDHLKAGIIKYGLYLALNYFVTYFLLKGMQDYLDITPYIGQFIAAGFMTFWNYFNYRTWVFKGPTRIHHN
ncbi:MAG TPA: GtrA family protein [Candidatus Saccharimonadales bacterium]|nr:GtrA family protein [Candidatus Saccharimonadales bacterium]